MLSQRDHIVFRAIEDEARRQEEHIELIASENYVSKAVLEAQGSILTNKYAEGYVGKRWYGGCVYVDVIEDIAIERLKKIFNCQFANVQPHSGSQANQAAFMALLEPGDTILGLSLDCGGHLTHGSSVNFSGKWFKSIPYHVHPSSYLLDYDEIEKLAIEHKPKLIIAGWSAYPRVMDMKKFRDIADKVGAYLMVDMAHFAGLVAADAYPNPVPYADVVTSTTHKTLRGPRGGIILCNDPAIAQKIDKAVFPGMQGGPLMHVIAAKAVAFGEVLDPSFKTYIQSVIQNAKVLAQMLQERGVKIITGGTDTHLLLVHLENITGKAACERLEHANITCNKNTIPFDTQSPFLTSGIRLGTPASTTRGFREEEFKQIAHWIADILESEEHVETVKNEVLALCQKFPVF